MRVEYRTTILQAIADAVQQATLNHDVIEHIYLTDSEWDELKETLARCSLGPDGMPSAARARMESKRGLACVPFRVMGASIRLDKLNGPC